MEFKTFGFLVRLDPEMPKNVVALETPRQIVAVNVDTGKIVVGVKHE